MMKWLRLVDAQKYIKKKTNLNIPIHRLRRWINEGLLNHSGFKILLRARKRYGTWFTTDEWIDEFIEEQNE